MADYSFVFLLLLGDLVVFSSWRKFLQDFLAGNKNRKSARKIYAQQTIKGKILLDYIYPLLEFNQDIFKAYYRIYACLVVTLIPQYVISIVLLIFFTRASGYFFGLVVFLKIVLFLVVRFQTDASRNSKYAFKSSRKKSPYKLKKESRGNGSLHSQKKKK